MPILFFKIKWVLDVSNQPANTTLPPERLRTCTKLTDFEHYPSERKFRKLPVIN